MNNSADFTPFNATTHRLVDDSRKVGIGDIYVCLPRSSAHSLQFCEQAVAQGAVALIATREVFDAPLNAGVPMLLLNDMDELGVWLRQWYQTVDTPVACIGITGTDGKTSVTWMLRESLQRYYQNTDRPIWSVGTLGIIRSSSELEVLNNTTPSLLTNHQLLAAATQQQAGALIWEVSSHGVAQQRIAGLNFDAVVWTTLGHDHLEDHGGYEAYASTKASFVRSEAGKGARLICNMDQPEVMRHISTPYIGYRQSQPADAVMEESAIFVLHWKLTADASLQLMGAGEKVTITGLPVGRFHAQNLTAVAVVLHTQWGIPLQSLPPLLNNMTTPPGRMQQVGSQMFVDFAHTPEALESMLQQARELTQGKLKLVFGCGGNRDRSKRAQMGAVASRYADEIWLTSDNPRNEEPDAIIQDIAQGVDETMVVCHYQVDRKAAIYAAVQSLEEHDLLVVAGKGHENYMEIAGQRFTWSDAEVIRQALIMTEAEVQG